MSRPDPIDELYSLPLPRFVEERNAFAKELRALGKRDEADRVKALVKPSVPAWVVNQLYRRHEKEFKSLLSAASRQRRATAKGTPDPSSVAEQRESLAALMRHASDLAAEAGSTLSLTLRRRVSRTLDAVAALGDRAESPLGRLTRELEPVGFDALLGLAIPETPQRSRLSKPSKPSKPAKSFKQVKPKASAAKKRRRERARQALEAVEADLTVAKAARTAAARRASRLAVRVEKDEKAARELQRRADQARDKASELSIDSRKANGDLKNAEAELGRVEARLESRRQALEELK